MLLGSKSKALLLISAIAVQGMAQAVSNQWLQQHYNPYETNRAYLEHAGSLKNMFNDAVDEIAKPEPNLILVNTFLDNVRRCRRGALTRELNDAAAVELMKLSVRADQHQRVIELIDSMSPGKQVFYAQLREESEALLQNQSMSTLNTTIDDGEAGDFLGEQNDGDNMLAGLYGDWYEGFSDEE